MDMETIEARHSVRQYLDKQIEQDKRTAINELIDEINAESGLKVQAFFDEPDCFSSGIAHYGKFENANNYLSLVGTKGPDLDEKAGYYGERIVLEMQAMGLNSCWVALTHGKSKAQISRGDKQIVIIAFGYGATQGSARKTKSTAALCNCADNMPDWFERGMRAVQVAPTAVNQQKFYFSLDGDKVSARVKGIGTCTKIDLGIVKYHFEVASGHKVV